MGDDLENHNKGFSTQGTIFENPMATGAEKRGQDMSKALDRAGRVGRSGTQYDLMSTLGAFGILIVVLGLASLVLWLT